MEHLLSGAAAVEGGKGCDENSPQQSNASAGDVAASEPAASSASSDDQQTSPVARELTHIQPMPKLPPISSLTHLRGVPQSLQSAPVHVQIKSETTALPPTRQPGESIPSADDGICRYRNKLCLHPRALKRNGELHNLCEKHRAKANQNQRKLESKRRVQKRQTRHTVSTPPRTYQLSPSGAPFIGPDFVGNFHHHPHTQSQMQAGAPLPSFAQLQRPQHPPPPPGASYPYYDGNYPPYSH